MDRQGPLLTRTMWGTSSLVAPSLSVSANVCGGAGALFTGQGKQIVVPFANEKKKKKRAKRSRAGSGERCLAGPGLHTHDFQFDWEEVEGINWRGETESMHVGKIHD